MSTGSPPGGAADRHRAAAARAVAEGQTGEALDQLIAALQLTPESAGTWWELAQVLSQVTAVDEMEEDQADHLINSCLVAPGVDPRVLAGFIERHLRRIPAVAEVLEADAERRDELLAAPELWRALSRPSIVRALQVVVLPSLDMEALFSGMRRAAALNGDAARDYPHLLAALACYAFQTGYVLPATARELAAIRDEATRMEEAGLGEGAHDAAHIALVGAYIPLYRWDLAGEILMAVAGGWAPELAALVRLQVTEPVREAALVDSIPRLGVTADATSEQVRSLYEAHPYPRWERLPHMEVATLSELLAGHRPGRHIPVQGPQEDPALASPAVLVAGCGTGLHPLGVSRIFPTGTVVGVDLSLSSLAFAARKGEELGIRNAAFAQADILELGSWTETFDVVESVGVLHHMANPEAGMAALADRLRPGGFMKLGLYSAAARREVHRARELARELGWPRDPDAAAGLGADEVRELRMQLTPQLVEAPWGAAVLRFRDYFTMDEFRDLVLHPHEDCFTLPRLADALQALEMEFVGFVNVPPLHREGFAARFPDPAQAAELACWAAWEEDHPDTFREMYQFWCRKPT